MKTVFKTNEKHNVMGFSLEGLQGGFYLMGDPILATLNGPYPIRNLSEKEAIEKSLFDHPIKGYCSLWLGSNSAYAIWDDAAAENMIRKMQ